MNKIQEICTHAIGGKCYIWNHCNATAIFLLSHTPLKLQNNPFLKPGHYFNQSRKGENVFREHWLNWNQTFFLLSQNDKDKTKSKTPLISLSSARRSNVLPWAPRRRFIRDDRIVLCFEILTNAPDSAWADGAHNAPRV